MKDAQGNAAIGLVEPGMVVRKTGSGHGYMWVELSEVVVASVYCLPNTEMAAFAEEVKESDFARRWSKPLIIGGDFNSRLRVWNDTSNTARGWVPVDAMASVDIVCTNRGTSPTYVREVWCQSVIYPILN